ncbi:MAG: hypothetical protein KC983_04350 [Phycisphaerales bacterium]|nr:hypothetical protein [Phycisphaerales bacterium]
MDKPKRPVPVVKHREKGKPVSPLVYVALGLACVPCIWPVTMIGVMLGAASAMRIRRSNGRRGGLRLAHAAILIGFASTMISLLLQAQLGRQLNDQIRIDSERLMNDMMSSDTTVRHAVPWSSASHVAASEVDSFVAEAEGRFGTFTSFSALHHTVSMQSMMMYTAEVAGTFVFTNETRPGAVVMRSIFDMGKISMTPTYAIEYVQIEDAEGGAMRLPAAADDDEKPAVSADDDEKTGSTGE